VKYTDSFVIGTFAMPVGHVTQHIASVFQGEPIADNIYV
jgi:hypothetical protein